MSRGIGIIFKSRKYLNEECFLTLYHCFICPLIYCNHVWGNTYKRNCRYYSRVLLYKRDYWNQWIWIDDPRNSAIHIYFTVLFIHMWVNCTYMALIILLDLIWELTCLLCNGKRYLGYRRLHSETNVYKCGPPWSKNLFQCTITNPVVTVPRLGRYLRSAVDTKGPAWTIYLLGKFIINILSQ